MDDYSDFYRKVREILKERGISLLQVQEDTGLVRQMFYKHGRKPRKSTLMSLAYYLGMTVEDLVDGTTAMDAWYC